MTYKASEIYLYNWGELYYEEAEIEASLDAIRILVDSQEKSLDAISEKFKKLVEGDPMYNSLAEEDRGSYYSHFFESQDRTISEIKRLQRNAMFMTIFAFFEGRLKSICQKIEEEYELSKKLTDSKGRSDLEKHWNYLVDVCKIDTTKIKLHFDLIEQQKFARNRVVHHEGYLSKDLKDRLNLVPGLEVNEYISNSQIEISDVVFLKTLLEQIEPFFKELLLAIDKRHKEVQI